MKYTYKNATGKTEIEVDEQFLDLLVAMDNDEDNNNRKHSRRYPISLENCEYDGEWFKDKNDLINDTETAIQWEQASASLTELQRLCFVEVCLNGKTHRQLATEIGITHQVVSRHIETARKKLKKYF